MDGKAAIKIVLDTGSLILSAYLADFNTQELLLRPHPEANQIAWQLGHLVVNERRCLKALSESHAVPMSEEFLQAHGGTGEQDFVAEEQYSKEHYLALMNQQRSLTLGYLDSLSTDQLTNPGPEHMRRYAPTIGEALLQQGIHFSMHAGQIAVVRRMLQKPIVI